MNCDFSNFTDERVEKLATQYRESANLIALIRNLVSPLESVGTALCGGTVFDIDTATGEHLTVIGNALGWPRTTCAGVRRRTFGFECDDDCRTDIGGFCSDWFCEDDDTPDVLQGEFTFTDDDLYRRFLKALVITYDNDFSRAAMLEAIRTIFGENAGILKQVPGRVDITTGRRLSSDEFAIAHIVEQVLPVAIGVSVGVYETRNLPPFGFGTGWGGFCDGEFPTQVVKGY